MCLYYYIGLMGDLLIKMTTATYVEPKCFEAVKKTDHALAARKEAP